MRFRIRCWFGVEIMLVILSDLRCRNNASRRPEIGTVNVASDLRCRNNASRRAEMRVNHRLEADATRTEQTQAGSLCHANGYQS